jgi:hypothetical protein
MMQLERSFCLGKRILMSYMPLWQHLQTENMLFTGAGTHGWCGYTITSSSGPNAQIAVGMEEFWLTTGCTGILVP